MKAEDLINKLELELRYYHQQMKEYRFERSQDEIDNSEMYAMYKRKILKISKQIELIRLEIKES
jgi:hypothetical protein